MKNIKTLQDLKNKIIELETELPDDITLDMIPLQHDITNEYTNIDIEIFVYSEFLYASINLD